MRKLFISIIASVYLLLSVGIAKSTHFCMGKEVNMEYFSHEAEGCFASDTRKMPCCQDVTEILSVDDEHQPVDFSKSFVNSFSILPALFALEYNSWINLSLEHDFEEIPDPPKLGQLPLYLSFQSLTYYG